MMEVIPSSETSVLTTGTRRNIQDGGVLQKCHTSVALRMTVGELLKLQASRYV
jgi:hypothetical protein